MRAIVPQPSGVSSPADVSRSVIGWDVGGAHLKAARVELGRTIDVLQLPSPLWMNLDSLTAGLRDAMTRLAPASVHVATMTGELADVFADRAEGVARLSEILAREVPGPLHLYAGRAGWVAPSAAAEHVADIASANWHASATLAASRVPDAVFVDMGSTTTDIIPVCGGAVAAVGYTDAERLACGELVYTGLTRSFVMSLAAGAPVAGRWTPLACEHFATSADVYRVLNRLPDDADQMPTADSREKTVAASRARLARMVGRDAAELDEGAWDALARWFAEMQLRRIEDAARLVLSRTRLPGAAPVIAAGIGQAVIVRLAARLERPVTLFADLIDPGSSKWVGHCAPAVAVAVLAQDGGLA